MENKKSSTIISNFSSVARKATVIRALDGNKFALDDGTIVDIGNEINDITVGSRVTYVKGGPGANTGFARIIGRA